jgi:hypothetical protein
MRNITLEDGQFGTYIVRSIETGDDLLVQTDWDFPSLASAFGFVSCDCGYTDGTVDCEHKSATQMICEAREYLDDHIGDVAEDPGYFTQEAN